MHYPSIHKSHEKTKVKYFVFPKTYIMGILSHAPSKRGFKSNFPYGKPVPFESPLIINQTKPEYFDRFIGSVKSWQLQMNRLWTASCMPRANIQKTSSIERMGNMFIHPFSTGHGTAGEQNRDIFLGSIIVNCQLFLKP